MAPMRRKSHGSIRSPHVKRNSQSQSTYEGWLFKLEGGALKQWKQRWCALVDFCLFFYKAPHEEKVISSILLPSYKINPCSADDKISKKFAFKAEHQNMKTYYFAAEDKESMKKWMNAMSLATIMQNLTYDDDESGFTSYRSRRDRSSSVPCSTAKQRSSSCGDRVTEKYLGSDDKYPAPSQSYNAQQRQPLYANAPPKPRRLTQTSIYPGEIDPSQYSVDSRYGPEENTMQYLPVDTEVNNPAYAAHYASSYADADLPVPESCESSDMYTMKPPRPHSADFLEREPESVVPQYTLQYCQNLQPQRPKSSLEYFNNPADCEDYEFDNYREAVRMQADNFYANKNLMKTRNFHESQRRIENVTKSDPRLNAHYNSQCGYIPNDSVPSSYHTHSKEQLNESQYRSYPTGQKFNSPGNSSKSSHNESKSSHNESMKRLLEWKQRMLQSPLSRRNQLQSTSSDTSSKHTDYSRQSLRQFETHKPNYSRSVQENGMSYQNVPYDRQGTHGLSSNNADHLKSESSFYDSDEKVQLLYKNAGKPEKQKVVPEASEAKCNSNLMLTDAADNLYQKNIMYCVDSENNEILFSYDTSPTESTAPAFPGSYYPPQMHSFTTLPNVNDIGVEPSQFSHYDPHQVRSKFFKNKRIPEAQNSVDVEKGITYTSDDEDEVIEECDLKETTLSPKETTAESQFEEKYFDERYQSSSPDYVNISSMYKDLDPVSTCGVYSSDSAFRGSMPVNKAVLKQLKQASKELPEQDSAFLNTSVSGSLKNFSASSLDKHVTEVSPQTKVKGACVQAAEFVDEVDCDIKREDYYRASQIFYSSMRMKNRLGASPNKNPGIINVCTPENVCQNSLHPNIETKSVKKIEHLDRDIGLPMPAVKMSIKMDLSAKAPESLSSEISDAKPDITNNKVKNVANKFDLKLDGSSVMKELSTDYKEPKKEMKKSLTYEEMRGQLLRKREAPPPNIVQERIKKFEKVKTIDENKKAKALNHSKLLESTLHTHKFVSRSLNKRTRQKNNRSRCQKRILHSDSEAIAFDDSDASSDDLTMKSAPILLSPLSSVLADLRKTADSNKEKVGENSLDRIAKKDFTTKIDKFVSSMGCDQGKNCHLSNSSSKSYNDFMLQSNEDAVYLPMYGIKAVQEPEYVTMSGCKFSSSVATGSAKYFSNRHHEEHVYNEPFSPPASFLHDVYEKQKKLIQYQVDSSSDDSSTENIYEKPTQRFSFDSCRNIRSAQETNFVLMNSSSCSNVASNTADKKTSQNTIPHHYEQAHISVSVPDLLQLQEIKDSDASDADDEASRDFDAPLSSSSSYAVQSSTNPNSDAYLTHPLKSSSSNSPHFNVSFEKVSCENSSMINASLAQSRIEGFKMTSDDSENVIHVRKLRVYTKGKKAEMPRMFPGPFNIEEAESPYSKYQAAESFSENVAYVSQGDIQSNAEDSDASFIAPNYAPDIISSIKEETTINESPYSKSSTSAPYYYSDLYSGYGLNFSGQFPVGLPCIDKISPPKSSTSLLNNIRPKSPCANKGDIGRKVNNINVETKSKQTSPDKLVSKSLNDDEVKNNIKHCLDVYQFSESKYLDAEKNKYEAGSTLEKTRTSNTMSYFKHRASTPDLNQPNEPVYENMFFQSKRMSQSLEEISAASKLPNQAENSESKLRSSPIYENIDFFNRIEERSLRMQQANHSQTSDTSRNGGNFSITHSTNENLDALEKHCLPTAQNDMITEVADDHHIHFLDHDHPNHFLDPDTLRHIDKQQLHSKTSKSLFVNNVNKALPDSTNSAARPSMSFENVEESCSYQMILNSDIPVYKVPKLKVNDLDSVSDGTSSFDEASADSDNRQRTVLGKYNSDGFHSCDSGLDVTSREASHIKKLVHRSHGLMTKGKRLSVSAGDLLGKTHEELVLLLIQLRRNQSKILKTKEKLEYRLKKERSGMLQMKNQSMSGQCEELYNQILYVEKQYKVLQPLVTLVDNMIKLGSLYGSSNRRSFSLPTLDRAQDLMPLSPSSNTTLQQTSILSKLLSEGDSLQKHMQEVNDLEQLHNEANSLSSLHQDKEMLEHTLFGMRNKILDHQDRPAELQKLRKQQRMIEKELVRVKRLLNSSAKKIEDATSKNDQMEQEILHLRQLLQQALKTGSSEAKSSQHNRADLEAELTRLQSVLDELANHRQEINNSVEKLKSEAGGSKGSEVRASPTGVAGSAPLPLRKKHHYMYLETDLDTMVTRDLAVSHEKDVDDIPVYANAEEISLSTDEAACPSSNEAVYSTSRVDPIDSELGVLQDINDADERMKRFYGILPKEKPCEIKTVRIVKRQSERRSRERDKKKVTYDEQSSVWIMEEPDLSSDDYLENEEVSSKKPQVQRPTSINLSSTTSTLQTGSKSAHERLFGTGTASRSRTLLQKAVKKPKRRHYTVSGYQYMLDPQFSQYFTERPRSRDDVDMERCLRTANTPDIVRSTIKKKDVFDDSLIDRELGLPQKIDIPERYVEVEPEHLSATERLQRSRKAENICKMLSQTTASYEDVVEKRNDSPEALHKKLSEEKRKRAQLLSLNQALAREVVERSKAVAANVYPLENQAT